MLLLKTYWHACGAVTKFPPCSQERRLPTAFLLHDAYSDGCTVAQTHNMHQDQQEPADNCHLSSIYTEVHWASLRNQHRPLPMKNFHPASPKTITSVLKTPRGLQHDLVMASLTGYSRNSSALEQHTAAGHWALCVRRFVFTFGCTASVEKRDLQIRYFCSISRVWYAR